MGYNSAFRGGLFIFECMRLIFLTTVLNILRPDAATSFPWFLYLVPNALFPIMLLFLWLDFDKYTVYEPLYKSGKCLCIFTVLGWYLFVRGSMLSFESGFYFLPLILSIVVLSDLFTIIASVLISVNNKKTAKGVTAVREGE